MDDSRLLQRFNAEIGSARSLLEADCLRAQRAAYRARIGEFERADADLATLHARYDGKPRAAISAWIHLAEGLRSHYTDLGHAARDKIQRAHALSTAAGLTSIQALCAAWLAHLAYLRMDAAAIARHVAQALALATPEDHAAQSRAHLVVAQALDEAGRVDLAKPWYERAHLHATTEGDDATVSAMMWNRAALRLATLRQVSCSGGDATALREQVRLHIDSTDRFDSWRKVQSLQSLQRILRAQYLAETGAHAQALALFDAHLDEALSQGLGGIASVLMADRAWCRLQLGDRDAALDAARHAEAHLHQALTHGDRAPAHSRLAQVFVALTREQEAQRHQALASAAWQGHVNDQTLLLQALAPLTPLGASGDGADQNSVMLSRRR